jgi:hypothetical protein
MTTTESPLHVMFNPSAAGTLQYALGALGRNDAIVRVFDDFSFGPIADDNPATRATWVEGELGYDWLDVSGRNSPVLEATAAARGPIVAWHSTNVAQVAAGFLWWLSHIGDTPCRVIRAPSIPVLRSEEIAALLGSDVALSEAERAICNDQWARLKTEDAPLRVIKDDELISAPITHFDHALLGNAPIEWRKMAFIVGTTLAETADTGVYQVGDLVLAARLTTLAEDGALESRGDLSHMTKCEIRLPRRRS